MYFGSREVLEISDTIVKRGEFDSNAASLKPKHIITTDSHESRHLMYRYDYLALNHVVLLRRIGRFSLCSLFIQGWKPDSNNHISNN